MANKKTSKNMSKTQPPVGVRVVSILHYVYAAFGAGIALLLFFAYAAFGAGAIDTLFGVFPILSLLGVVGVALFVFIGVIVLGFAILAFFMGKGLWKGKNWARVLAIIFAILGVIFTLSGLTAGVTLQGIIMLAVNGFVFVYLLFIKEAKNFFRK